MLRPRVRTDHQWAYDSMLVLDQMCPNGGMRVRANRAARLRAHPTD